MGSNMLDVGGGVGVNEAGIVVIEGVKFSICVGIEADMVDVDECSGVVVTIDDDASAGSSIENAKVSHMVYVVCCTLLKSILVSST